MDFLKKHYEKVLLGVVLVGLAAAVVFLMLKIPSEQQELDNKRLTLIAPNVKPLSNLNLTLPEAALKRVAAPSALGFGPPNKLFNSMKWQRAVDQHLIKVEGGNVGPEAVQTTKLTPLYTILALDSVTVPESGSARYRINVERQAATSARDRGRTQKYGGIGDKNEIFKFEAAYGPTDNPTNVVLTLNDTGDKVSVSKEVPFKRVDGSLADLKYPPENKTWTGRRVGSQITFNNEDYKIVVITTNEVVLMAPSGKKWTRPYNPNLNPTQ